MKQLYKICQKHNISDGACKELEGLIEKEKEELKLEMFKDIKKISDDNFKGNKEIKIYKGSLEVQLNDKKIDNNKLNNETMYL